MKHNPATPEELASAAEKTSRRLKKSGFAKAGSFIIGSEDRDYLRDFIDRSYEERIGTHDVSSCTPVISDLVGKDNRVDRIFNDLLTNPLISQVFESVHGPHYKIWEISARYSIPGDPGLALHQDAFGQMNLAINLSEHEDDLGVTSLIKGSHMLYRWSNKLSWSRASIGNRFATPLRFGTTDVAFFLNKTWHGRTSNQGPTTKKVILIGTFPPGGKYKPTMDEATVERIDPSNHALREHLDFRKGTKILESGECIVESADANFLPFSVELEDSKKFLLPSVPLFLKLGTIQAFFWPIRWAFQKIKRLRAFKGASS